MQPRPTHSALTSFLLTLLPPKPNDIPFLYHVPRHPSYDPEHALADQIVLSITPTPGVYDTIGYAPPRQEKSGEMAPRAPRTLCFLHRAFALERRRVRRDTLVIASHAAFDENVTVGWNGALAAELGMDVGGSECVRGYKGNPERRIGIVGLVAMEAGAVEGILKRQFGGVEAGLGGVGEDCVRVLAIMNAFGAEEVYRVLDVAEQRGWITDEKERRGRHVLYLTGQPRESGMAAAREHGLRVACVGHRAAEEWGLRYIARCLRDEFPGVEVKEIYEDEAPPTR